MTTELVQKYIEVANALEEISINIRYNIRRSNEIILEFTKLGIPLPENYDTQIKELLKDKVKEALKLAEEFDISTLE
jgi:hypothetical protein